MTVLLAATVRLADALAAENDALRALDLPAATFLLAEKQRAAAVFEAARSDPPSARSPAMQEAAERLVRQAEENRRLLERAIKVQTRVLGVVANAARSSQPVPRYGRSGTYAPGQPTGWALSARA